MYCGMNGAMMRHCQEACRGQVQTLAIHSHRACNEHFHAPSSMRMEHGGRALETPGGILRGQLRIYGFQANDPAKTGWCMFPDLGNLPLFSLQWV